MDSAGDFVIAWTDYSGEDGSDRHLRPGYNSGGVAQGGQFQVNTYTSGFQQHPAAAMDAAGDFVITWDSYVEDGSKYGVYAQRYNASGDGPGKPVPGQHVHHGQPVSSRGGHGLGRRFRHCFLWLGASGVDYGIYAQRYNQSGVAQGSEFLVNSSAEGANHFDPSVAMDAAGDFVVAWETPWTSMPSA